MHNFLHGTKGTAAIVPCKSAIGIKLQIMPGFLSLKYSGIVNANLIFSPHSGYCCVSAKEMPVIPPLKSVVRKVWKKTHEPARSRT